MHQYIDLSPNTGTTNDLEINIPLGETSCYVKCPGRPGIPCRVVTNYESAHDTNSNLLVEHYYKMVDGDISDDSIW